MPKVPLANWAHRIYALSVGTGEHRTVGEELLSKQNTLAVSVKIEDSF